MASVDDGSGLLHTILDHNSSKIFIGLLGDAGAGKSSLINTINMVFGKSTRVPTAPIGIQGGHTQVREPIKLTNHITIFDNRGWHDWNNETAINLLESQIAGETSTYERVVWEEKAMVKKESKTLGPLRVSDQLTNMIFVMRGDAGIEAVHGADKVNAKAREGIGRTPIIVVTHVDKMKGHEKDQLKSDLTRQLWIPVKQIFFIQNVTDEQLDLVPHTKTAIIQMLSICIAEGPSAIERHALKEKERIGKVEHAECLAVEAIEIHNRESEKEMSTMKVKAERVKLDTLQQTQKYKEQEEMTETLSKAEERKRKKELMLQDKENKIKEGVLMQERATAEKKAIEDRKKRELERIQRIENQETMVIEERKQQEQQERERVARRSVAKAQMEKNIALEKQEKEMEILQIKAQKAQSEREKAEILKEREELEKKGVIKRQQAEAERQRRQDEVAAEKAQLDKKMAKEKHDKELQILRDREAAQKEMDKLIKQQHAKEVERMELDKKLKELEIKDRKAQLRLKEVEMERQEGVTKQNKALFEAKLEAEQENAKKVKVEKKKLEADKDRAESEQAYINEQARVFKKKNRSFLEKVVDFFVD